jgi:tRNA A-37 threonylcarbamoyl transferase component Bud32
VNTSSSFLGETNRIIAQRASLFDLVSRRDLGNLLRELNFNWQTYAFNPSAEIVPLLTKEGLLDETSTLPRMSRIGALFLSRLLVHFDVEKLGTGVFGDLNLKYADFKTLSAGKNSIVVLARHKLLGSRVVLKIVRPGASADIASSVGKLSKIRPDTAIVLPNDFVEVATTDLLDKPVTLGWLVFPFVEGITFREFLVQKNHHLNSQVVLSFAKQIGGALRELEEIGAYHGDLHEANILVDQFARGGARFRVVDISFDAMGSLPFEQCRNNDLSNLKQHLWRLMSMQKAFMPRMSLRKYIGSRNYFRIMDALSEDAKSFSQVCHALSSDDQYTRYVTDRSTFIIERFHSPVSFRLQRYEEITDATIAVRLFVPYEPLMKRITGFSNVYVSGNRGSGKSTYLAALAFFPQAESKLVSADEIFGVYFPCRQGEFRPLSANPNWSAETERGLLTNLLVTKIVRRTLELLGAGVGSGRLGNPTSFKDLHDFVSLFVSPPGIISVDRDIQSDLENLVSTMVRVEMEEIEHFRFANALSGKEKNGRALLEFFRLVRETFGELATTRFHLLFDDAGTPYVPENVQQAICDLILTSNSVFCVKLSAEKFTFGFCSSEGKVLENGQDYFEHDISQILFIGSGSAGLSRVDLEQHFRKIVDQRLSHFSYQSGSITDYLGDGQVSSERLLKFLALGRKDAHYCGWTAVWNIADRTPRNLIEIVSEIFSVGGVERDTQPEIVGRREQDRAIRTISEKRFESLSQISGSIEIQGKTVSLGRHLFEATAAIGSTFKRYLKSVASQKRIRQHLAIERNDQGELSREAEVVLRRLITFGVLDSGRTSFARDDELKKPFYVLNRIYCPAFSIGYRRDDHLRLSTGKMELLLINPPRFMREGTKRLRDGVDPISDDMFGYDLQE